MGPDIVITCHLWSLLYKYNVILQLIRRGCNPHLSILIIRQARHIGLFDQIRLIAVVHCSVFLPPTEMCGAWRPLVPDSQVTHHVRSKRKLACG